MRKSTFKCALQSVHTRRLIYLQSVIWLFIVFVLGLGAGMLADGKSALAATTRTTDVQQKCTEEHPKPSFGNTVVVGSGEVVCGSLTSVGGTSVVQGEVKGDIVTFGGNVVIDGNVDGNVALYGGNLTLQNGAHVNGNIHVCGGQWIEGQDSQLHGNVFDCTKSVGILLLGNNDAGFHFWSLVAWIGLAWLLSTLLPEHVMLVRTTVQSKVRRSFLLGLLTVLLTPAIMAVLVSLIIPIPLAIIVAIGLIAAWALGTVAIGWLIGERLLHAVAPQHNSRLLQVVAGTAVLALAGSLPYIGWIISIGAGLLGLGAVFLSRFGTRLYSQPKQPLSL
ncbi:MAG TPA: polymer-forming cytoskeletal protein [Ktedonobacteraceae bacterium]|nr:polymer-forming cytoskeletal protein [Ktedonobacteraceae bacterium]